MNCTWCDKNAVAGGKKPRNFQGPEYLTACPDHLRLIEKLGYIAVEITELEMIERRKKAEK